MLDYHRPLLHSYLFNTKENHPLGLFPIRQMWCVVVHKLFNLCSQYNERRQCFALVYVKPCLKGCVCVLCSWVSVHLTGHRGTCLLPHHVSPPSGTPSIPAPCVRNGCLDCELGVVTPHKHTQIENDACLRPRVSQGYIV